MQGRKRTVRAFRSVIFWPYNRSKSRDASTCLLVNLGNGNLCGVAWSATGWHERSRGAETHGARINTLLFKPLKRLIRSVQVSDSSLVNRTQRIGYKRFFSMHRF